MKQIIMALALTSTIALIACEKEHTQRTTQIVNGSGDFVNSFYVLTEYCYDGIVYIKGRDHGHKKGYLSPKIDKTDRLPKVCE